jgi:hypothetical protein
MYGSAQERASHSRIVAQIARPIGIARGTMQCAPHGGAIVTIGRDGSSAGCLECRPMDRFRLWQKPTKSVERSSHFCLRMTHWDELLRWVEATALCAALLVDKVQVWKDVNGKLTFDPRMVLGDARAECLARRSG